MAKFRKKDALALGISTTGIGISAANLGVNMKRQRESKEYQEKQLKAMEKLTDSLNKVDSSLKNSPKTTEKRPKFRFFQRNNSNTAEMTVKGAALGGAIAGGSIPFLPKKIGTKWSGEREVNVPNYPHPKFRAKYNGMDQPVRNALIELGGIAIGASLGFLAGAIMDISDSVSKKMTVNQRLMKDVLVNLKKMGFSEGRDYTRDPKVAGLLKTRVCLVVSKSSDELRLLINTASDRKLDSITKQIVKNLPTMSTVTEKVTDRFNEINITTMTSNNGDALWIATLAEKFIKENYPVYLIEVG